MPDIQDLFYHGVRHSIRMVLEKMGEERLDKGLTAFEDGSHDWGNCFFARAFKGELDLQHTGNPEFAICRAIGVLNRDGQPNVVPVRTIWHTFDHASRIITADELKQFIIDVRDESRPAEVMQLLRSLNVSPSDETTEVEAHACGIN